MQSMLLIIASFLMTILAWGLYGPTLHVGQELMSTEPGYARLRPFVCVGLAYWKVIDRLRFRGKSRRIELESLEFQQNSVAKRTMDDS